MRGWVTAETVRLIGLTLLHFLWQGIAIAAAAFAGMTVSDVIAMKVQGVTAEYVKGLQSAGLKLDAHGVIGAKVQGITPEFIQKARSHGFQNLSLDKLMMLKHSGVLDE